MQDLMFKSWVKTQMVKQNAKDKLHSVRNRMMSENGGAESIIIAVILILVVVVLGFVFKDYIISWFNKLVGKSDEAINSGANPDDWGISSPT